MWGSIDTYIAEAVKQPEKIPYGDRPEDDWRLFRAPVAFPGHTDTPGSVCITSQQYQDCEIVGYHLPSDAPSVVNISTSEHDPITNSTFSSISGLDPGEVIYTVRDATLYPLSLMEKIELGVMSPGGRCPRYCGLDLVLVRLPHRIRKCMRDNGCYAKLHDGLGHVVIFTKHRAVSVQTHVFNTRFRLPNFRQLGPNCTSESLQTSASTCNETECKTEQMVGKIHELVGSICGDLKDIKAAVAHIKARLP